MKPALFQILNGIRISIILIAILAACIGVMEPRDTRTVPLQLACIAVIAALKSSK